jgi:hypothetical protein
MPLESFIHKPIQVLHIQLEEMITVSIFIIWNKLDQAQIPHMTIDDETNKSATSKQRALLRKTPPDSVKSQDIVQTTPA